MSTTILLSTAQIRQRIQRLAWQLFEDNSDEKEIVLVGILHSGNQVAMELAAALRSICQLSIRHVTIKIDKHSQVAGDFELSAPVTDLEGKVIIVVDDVLNSGKTLLYALRPFLSVDVKKIRTVVLVDRNHRRFPVAADYAGLSLATTLKEHISVESTSDGLIAYLS
jgi:pyrimidine operon attenuation protein/uracil phosphoribosyltransferase